MKELCESLQRCLLCPAEDAASLQVAVNWLRALVQKAHKARERASRASWEAWKKQQEKEGGEGGLLYKFVKRTQEDPEVAARCLAGPSLAVEDVVAADFRQWDTLWQKLQHVARASWRGEGCGLALRKLDHRSLRRAARTFKVKNSHRGRSPFPLSLHVAIGHLAAEGG